MGKKNVVTEYLYCVGDNYYDVKIGSKFPIIGNSVVIDGEVINLNVEDVCGFIRASDNTMVEVLDGDAIEYFNNIGCNDLMLGDYSHNGDCIVFKVDSMKFKKEKVSQINRLEFLSAVVSGFVMPTNTNMTEAIDHLSMLNKAYNIGLTDKEIGEKVLEFTDWAEGIVVEKPKVEKEDKIVDALGRIEKSIRNLDCDAKKVDGKPLIEKSHTIKAVVDFDYNPYSDGHADIAENIKLKSKSYCSCCHCKGH